MHNSLGTRSPRTRYPKQARNQRKVTNNRFTAQNSKATRKVEKINQKLPKLPHWLNSLLRFQHTVSWLTFLTVVGTLGVYSWTVYNEQRWNEEYRTLENLQRDERQLTATNETLKNQLAEEAETEGMGLVLATPAKTLFLTPSNKPAFQPKQETKSNDDQPKSEKIIPLGY